MLTSGAACITLASNNTLRGFNLSNTGGTGLVGNNFGNLVVAETSVNNSNGAAINLNTGNPTATFTSVSANGGTNGISLTSTTGSFAVTGTGGLCSAATPACTGGTISNVTDTGVKLTNASNITLTRMRVQNSPNFGLNGSTVNTMNIDTCLFDGTHGSAIDEGAIFVTNWFGSGTISNSEITGGANDNVRVTNTAGALNRLTISNTTIRDNSTVVPGNHGLRFATDVASGAGAGVVMNLTVTGSTFRNNHSNHIDTGATGQSTMDLVLDSNTFTSNATTLAGAVNITDDHQADVTFDVNSNTMNGAQLSAFNFFMSNQTTVAASMVGKFRNNIIGTSGVAGSGSAQGNGVDFTSTGLGTFTVNVTGNTVRQFAGIGIGFSGGDTSPRVNATVTGNTIKEGDAVIGLNAISFNMGSTAAGAVVACADLGGAGVLRNDVSGSVPNGTGEIRVRQRNSSTVQLPGLTGAVDAFLAGRNIVTNTAAVTFTGAFGNNGGAACTQAP
ncbi:MAG: hypothetical protein JNJ76_01130 [Candidatus Competibacter sp.]|nr:hypothetical protein [Candidatus Competibacter sp.]